LCYTGRKFHSDEAKEIGYVRLGKLSFCFTHIL
jgi:hypothetical protein